MIMVANLRPAANLCREAVDEPRPTYDCGQFMKGSKVEYLNRFNYFFGEIKSNDGHIKIIQHRSIKSLQVIIFLSTHKNRVFNTFCFKAVRMVTLVSHDLIKFTRYVLKVTKIVSRHDVHTCSHEKKPYFRRIIKLIYVDITALKAYWNIYS